MVKSNYKVVHYFENIKNGIKKDIDGFNLVSLKIMIDKEYMDCGFLEYRLIAKNMVENIYAFVSVKKLEGNYKILFPSVIVEDKDLDRFIEYLKENHERNIMELSL